MQRGNPARRVVLFAREALSLSKTFTVVFYGSAIFCCKTAQFSEPLRKSVCSGLALKNTLRNRAKTRAKSLS